MWLLVPRAEVIVLSNSIPSLMRSTTVGACLTWIVVGQTCLGAGVDSWRGLSLGRSSPADAVRILGKPSRDERSASNSFEPIWGTTGVYSQVKHERKDLRELTFNRMDGFQSVRLTFYREVLALVRLEPRRGIPIDEFRAVYGVDLKFWNLSKSDQLLDQFEPDREPTNVTLTGEGGPYTLLRAFYLIGSQNDNVMAAFGSTFTSAEHGTIDKIMLVHRGYVETKHSDNQRPASELLK